MSKRVPVSLAITLTAALFAAIPNAGATATSGVDPRLDTRAEAVQWIKTHGYLPLNGIDTLERQKEHAAAVVAGRTGGPAPAEPSGGANPIIGASWQGVSNTFSTPPDANGAIGPSSYIEIINQNIAVYNRSGGLITSATLATLTGDFGFLTDPMIFWDPNTQRFYYNLFDVNDSKMDWGFSKDANPTSIPGGWCTYISDFGYTTSELPDYPKLGQTRNYLLIGLNHYTEPNFGHADRTDVLWIDKYDSPDPVTTCPAASTFNNGKFTDLRNEDGSIAFTPVPPIQTDSSTTTSVVTMSDIECPDICGTGMSITVHGFRPTPGNPSVPQLKVTGQSITVSDFQPPPDAPQKGSTDTLHTLDGRLTHAVSGRDPAHGNKMAIWVSHSVLGGAGSEIRWYEINPAPINNPTMFQTGVVTSPSLYVFNSGISNDRACSLTTCAHGDSMVLGFTTSSSTQFAAVQMVSKIGLGSQSAFVLVKQSNTFDNDFSCTPNCRWGDYGGATPDPTKTGGTTGEVWLSNQWTDGTAETWNWEATP